MITTIHGGFNNCKLGLKTLVIPSNININGISKSVTKLGYANTDYDGYYCGSFGINVNDVSKIILPDTIELISEGRYWNREYGVFSECANLKEINLPSSLKYIGACAFYRCTSLEEIVIPELEEGIGYGVFKDCTSLKEIHVPFNKGEKPSNWDEDWKAGCDAKIIYANGEVE